MFCSHCGKEIMDEAEICVGCGCRVNNKKFDMGSLGIAGFICSCTALLLSLFFASIGLITLIFLIVLPDAIAGLVLSIIGAIKSKKNNHIIFSYIGIILFAILFCLLILCL